MEEEKEEEEEEEERVARRKEDEDDEKARSSGGSSRVMQIRALEKRRRRLLYPQQWLMRRFDERTTIIAGSFNEFQICAPSPTGGPEGGPPPEGILKQKIPKLWRSFTRVNESLMESIQRPDKFALSD